jgi:hypothetical protein
LDEWRRDLSLRNPAALNLNGLAAEVVRFWRTWDSSRHGDIEYAIAVWAYDAGERLNPGRTGAISAFLRGALKLEARRASEVAYAAASILASDMVSTRTVLRKVGVSSASRDRAALPKAIKAAQKAWATKAAQKPPQKPKGPRPTSKRSGV